MMNLIHIQAFLLGGAQVLAKLRSRSRWAPAMAAWRYEQERQLRVLLVLFKQVGGDFGIVNKVMLELARIVGWTGGAVGSCLPTAVLRLVMRQMEDTLITGLERAGHQIAIADWAGWEIQPSINPPKALLELAGARREWPSKWEGLVQFL
ncbi:MAG: hypothetical protein HY075_04890 [Deltaproteobacteria bacterium]|nr:hypothetical protein [Deltaproteobacteria bacterium]